ncbi:MAG: 50S ribosomal protein L35 [Elusimicrobiota bacterium]
MPKLKSHSGAKKRFFISATGIIKRKKTKARHLLTDKSARKMRHLRKSGELNLTDTKLVRTVLPYL